MARTVSGVSGSIVAIAALVAVPLALAVDVKVDFDKTFDFKPLRTWSWSAAGPGEVKMARTAEDDPDVAKRVAEPIVMDAVTVEMNKRGLPPNAVTPDFFVTYYLLLTTTAAAQTIGQFLPATTQWGVPPFLPSTQSLEVMNQGSLVLDVSVKGPSGAAPTVVWRGVAQAKLKMDSDPKKREALLREAVRDLVKKFPPKP